jgi:hypothetical protein
MASPRLAPTYAPLPQAACWSATRWLEAATLSASDPLLYFGLGSKGRIDRLDVEWPWRSIETWHNPAAGRLYQIEAGKTAYSSFLEAGSS